MGFFSYVKPLGTGNKAFPKLDKLVNNLAFGKPEENYQQSLITPSQQKLPDRDWET